MLLQGLHGLRGTGSRGGSCTEDERFGRHLLEEFPKVFPSGKSHGNVFVNNLGTKMSVLMNCFFGTANK